MYMIRMMVPYMESRKGLSCLKAAERYLWAEWEELRGDGSVEPLSLQAANGHVIKARVDYVSSPPTYPVILLIHFQLDVHGHKFL